MSPPSAWVFDGVSINAMRKRARIRETVHYEAIYRWHPHFADADFRVWAEGTASGAASRWQNRPRAVSR